MVGVVVLVGGATAYQINKNRVEEEDDGASDV
jgi:hypothetical protein